MSTIEVRVASKANEADGICSYELVRTDGAALPGFEAGAHVDVHLPGSLVRQYSFCNAPGETHRYQIGVLRDAIRAAARKPGALPLRQRRRVAEARPGGSAGRARPRRPPVRVRAEGFHRLRAGHGPGAGLAGAAAARGVLQRGGGGHQRRPGIRRQAGLERQGGDGPAGANGDQGAGGAWCRGPVSREEGVCGTCLTRVLEGVPDHREMYLTEEEQAANDQFTLCCSRAKTKLLLLDW